MNHCTPSSDLIVAIVGPTATGKSSLAESLAQKLDGEIVSADSMQVYQGMDIGTAKMPIGRRGVRYHCINLVSPDEEFNAFLYQRAARAAFEDIWSRGKQVILCGGTGLYVRTALEAFVCHGDDPRGQVPRVIPNDPRDLSPRVVGTTAPGRPVPSEPALEAFVGTTAPGRPVPSESAIPRASELRQRLTKEAEDLGPEAFHAKLAAIDPQSAALIHPNNVRRVIRAFEWLEQGSSYMEQAAGFASNTEVYPVVYLGLTLPREKLYKLINERVRQMIEQGLLQEVQGLLDKGYGQALTSQQAIGYKELVGVLSGAVSLDIAVEQIQQATRRYAKRQLSWFKRNERIHWLDAQKPLDELTEEADMIITKEMT